MSRPASLFTVRSHVGNTSGLDGLFRVYFRQETLDRLSLRTGELIEIGDESGVVMGYGFAWRAPDKLGQPQKVTEIRVTETLMETFGISAEYPVSIDKTRMKLRLAERVLLADVTPPGYTNVKNGESEEKNWMARCRYLLAPSEMFAVGEEFDVNGKNRSKKRFRVQHVESAETDRGLFGIYYCTDDTVMAFKDKTNIKTKPILDGGLRNALSAEYIGGLQAQIEKLNLRMNRVLNATKETPKRYLNHSALIHGYEGTGKSLILDRMELAPFKRVFRIDGKISAGNSAQMKMLINGSFEDASENQPSLVLMDNFNRLAPADGKNHADLLVEKLRALSGSRVFLVAACRSPNDIDPRFLAEGLLQMQVELQIPDQAARFEILKMRISQEYDEDNALARELSFRTHGFTGRDISLLVSEGEHRALDRCDRLRNEQYGADASSQTLNKGSSTAGAQAENNELLKGDEKLNVERAAHSVDSYDSPKMEDFEAALSEIRPTALREIFSERPRISWDDIGGSQEIKKRLDRIISWPLQRATMMRKYDTKSSRGVLLYGPPGCSKTLTAQAVARMYNSNFISIKGAENVSMYVGESERAIREVFRKARMAAPCVIFFDEIDSIAGQRDAGGIKGLNVLTTLLNEMDGFERSEGVTVLAATNRPESLDPAIMRPGRFDSHIYLGLPTEAARREILAIQTKNVMVETRLDFDELAKVMEGYTGAEIVHICQLAKEEAMEQEIEAAERDDPDGIAETGILSMEHFEVALKQTPRGVTEEMLAKYDEFAGRDVLK